MLPISLYIEGLNSYAEPVVIDFKEFYKNNIFGIFGDTGSGKSTIIDAIMLALYGKTPRLGRGIKEATNPTKNQINIKFTFSIKAVEYRIERVIGKNSRVKLYDIENGNTKALAEKENEFTKNIKKIVGLNEEEFSKVVVLPQNQFAEILKINPSERATLIGNLFDLNVYGDELYNLITMKLSKLEGLKVQHENRLDELKDISEQSVKKIEDEIKEINSRLEQSQDEHKALTERFQVINRFYELNKRLTSLNEEVNRLLQRQGEINDLKNKLALDDAVFDCKNDYKEWLILRESIPKQRANQDDIKKSIDKLQKEFDNCKTENEDFQKNYDERQVEITKTITELEHCISIREKIIGLQSNQKAITEKLSKMDTEQKVLEEEIMAMSKEIGDIQKAINDMQNSIKDCQISHEDSKLYNTLPMILREITLIESINKEIKEINEKVKCVSKKYQQKSNKLKSAIAERLGLNIDNPDEIPERLDEKIKTLREKEEETSQRLKGLEIKNMALSISQHLQTGMPCPVCGSIEHPNPARGDAQLEINQTIQEIKGYQNEIRLVETVKSEIKDDLNSLVSLKLEISQSERLLKEKEDKLSSLEDALKTRLPKDDWQSAQKNFDMLREKKERYEKTLQELNTLNNTLAEKTSINSEKDRQKTRLQSDIENKKGQLKYIQQEITEYNNQLFQKTKGNNPDVMKKEIEAEKDKLNRQKSTLNQKIKDLEDSLNKLKLQLQSVTTALDKDISRHEEISKSLTCKAQEMSVKEIEDLKRFFIGDDEKLRLKKEVDNYETMLNTKKGELEGIKKQIDELPIKEIQPNDYQNTEKRLRELNESITEMNKGIGALTELGNKQRKDLQEKENLSKEITNIRKDYENASTLKALIRGKEMVKFFSWCLLTDVLKLTNEFLKDLKMSNRFYVEANKNLEFTITDLYYNTKRPVVTLSGGETFILSFALALALSNFIQGRRQRAIGFFFIDEGFSSLDKDLLESVGNVLNQLVSQDRFVGLISHLDALKQLIPKYLYVKRDANGSSNIQLLGS